ncbi:MULTISPECIES: hypothetical protein [Enterobacter]|uniref:Bulb-type lectin domain-containing protein n=1 Tax=Enterobacter asburiae TaxID=61645 RepID=A0ABU6KVJ0_ENTAS|nr:MULTISPECIES: hypothetical protein [Enterobacter]MCK1017157.1 hypothetical protein [Enterobacter asburiae]MDO2449770.1 hypothetical protein [Enterobacter vonholyi]MDU2341981.1 hypothetical protein [Enterobacter asburiae]MDU7759763.1 hypothetical protein [Enterobacter asburiae]MEC5729325.1 hypothetical protein [Enterobacter asburiae]
MSNISFDPFKTQGSPTGMFNVESRGLVQGDAQDDPAIRLQLSSGTWSGADPVWAGVGAMECIATDAANIAGSNMKPATAAVCNAFIVSNQAYHGIITAGNNVPLYVGNGSVHYYRVGSGARIPLPVSAAVAALATGDDAVGADGFVWDLTNNVIDVYSSATSGNPKLDIKLLMVSQKGNLTVKKNTDGTVVWENDKPCGLFLI